MRSLEHQQYSLFEEAREQDLWQESSQLGTSSEHFTEKA